MHPTKNDLPAKVRSKVIATLGDRLADATDLMLQTKQAHWNVKGPSFIALHELFDKINEAAEEWVDLIAERIVQLGGTAEGTVQATARRTSLESYPLDDHRAARTTSKRSRTRSPRSARRSAPRSTRPARPATPTPRTSSPRSRATSTSTSGSSRRTPRSRSLSGRRERAASGPETVARGEERRRAETRDEPDDDEAGQPQPTRTADAGASTRPSAPRRNRPRARHGRRAALSAESRADTSERRGEPADARPPTLAASEPRACDRAAPRRASSASSSGSRPPSGAKRCSSRSPGSTPPCTAGRTASSRSRRP